jgi:ABC-type transport system substrate-binding protein
MLAGWKDTNNDGFWDISPDGLKRNLVFTLLANQDENNTIRSDAAVLMASQLEKAGIKVELKTATWDDYTNMLNEKRFDLALCGCYLSPVPDYKPLLGSGGALNVGGYQSQEMDSLLESILQSPRSDILKVNIGELQSRIIEDLPIICLYFRYHSLMTSLDLKSVSDSISGAREEDAFARISQWYKAQ